MTALLVGSGLVVDRFDQDHPRQAQLLYVMDADRATAMWASRDPVPDAWTAQYVPNAYGYTRPPLPLPYGNHPKWIGTAEVMRIDPPRIQMLESRSAGDTTTVKGAGRLVAAGGCDRYPLSIRTVQSMLRSSPPTANHPSLHYRPIPTASATAHGHMSCVFTTLHRTGSPSRCRYAVTTPQGFTSQPTSYANVACSNGATWVMPSMIARWERFPNPRTSWGGSWDLVERLALIP
jgi:hypothetical protein